ncbi:hypothetical protein B0H19DRAFT_1256476 [Mycena capillaripes]|nr:hypothetical protein B0H19DRAFT_1256476 [Mycena capillaripes]
MSRISCLGRPKRRGATFRYGPNGNGDVQIMGSGNPDIYAVGGGPSISGQHVQGRALDGASFPGYALFQDVPAGTAGYSTYNSPATALPRCRTSVMDGQAVPSCILIRNHSNSPWVPLCSPNSGLNSQCAGSFILLGGMARRGLDGPLTLAIDGLGFSTFPDGL